VLLLSLGEEVRADVQPVAAVRLAYDHPAVGCYRVVPVALFATVVVGVAEHAAVVCAAAPLRLIRDGLVFYQVFC